VKAATIVIAIAGLVLGTCVIGYFGFGAVAHAFLAVGWTGFAAVCAFHAALYCLLGLAWWVILPPPRAVPVPALIAARVVRDSGSEVLPLSQIGGFVMGARAATLLGLPAASSSASTIVDVTLELVAQIAYVALGLGLLVWYRPGSALAAPVAAGMAAAVVLALGFIIVQRRGLALVERLAHRLAARWLPAATAHAAPVQQAVQAIYGHGRGIRLGLVLHVAGWIANAVEAWIALAFLGAHLGLGPVLAIESLLYAARSVAFAVPNAVGVQEGVYVVLGGLFGLPPETALALSLLKRARDLAIGVPALVAWQAVEGGRLWRRGAKSAAALDRKETHA
jgi:glycosyltransferase 2 family protein